MRRIKWAYEATLDYISTKSSGEWVIGFLDEEGNPYECPTTNDENLINKLKKLEFKKLKVTVEVNEKLDSWGKQYPILLDVEVEDCRAGAEAGSEKLKEKAGSRKQVIGA